MPTWTKKDYQVVAMTLYRSPLDPYTKHRLADLFQKEFYADNALFDANRFREAVSTGTLFRVSPVWPAWGAKTFRMIARVLKEARERGIVTSEEHGRLVEDFSSIARQTNWKFDPYRFQRAAGFTSRRPGEVSVRPHVRRKKL